MTILHAGAGPAREALDMLQMRWTREWPGGADILNCLFHLPVQRGAAHPGTAAICHTVACHYQDRLNRCWKGNKNAHWQNQEPCRHLWAHRFSFAMVSDCAQGKNSKQTLYTADFLRIPATPARSTSREVCSLHLGCVHQRILCSCRTKCSSNIAPTPTTAFLNKWLCYCSWDTAAENSWCRMRADNQDFSFDASAPYFGLSLYCVEADICRTLCKNQCCTLEKKICIYLSVCFLFYLNISFFQQQCFEVWSPNSWASTTKIMVIWHGIKKKTLQKLYKPTEESLWHTLKFTCSENKSRGISNRVVLTAETSVWATEQPDLTAK